MFIKAYERIADTLLLGQPKAKRSARVCGNRMVTGAKSLHRTPQSRKWRTFWRLKSQRVVGPEFYWKTKPSNRDICQAYNAIFQ